MLNGVGLRRWGTLRKITQPSKIFTENFSICLISGPHSSYLLTGWREQEGGGHLKVLDAAAPGGQGHLIKGDMEAGTSPGQWAAGARRQRNWRGELRAPGNLLAKWSEETRGAETWPETGQSAGALRPDPGLADMRPVARGALAGPTPGALSRVAAGGRHAGRDLGHLHTRSHCPQPVGGAVARGALRHSRCYPRMEPWCRTPAPSVDQAVLLRLLLLLLLLRPASEPALPPRPPPASPALLSAADTPLTFSVLPQVA